MLLTLLLDIETMETLHLAMGEMHHAMKNQIGLVHLVTLIIRVFEQISVEMER